MQTSVKNKFFVFSVSQYFNYLYSWEVEEESSYTILFCAAY